MSASLVGSEMCIRDRSKRSPLRRRRGPWWGSAACHRRSAASRAASLGAVSYTHLTLPTICSV
eukprot:5951439-Alexandrium_andersonii.AAC.1